MRQQRLQEIVVPSTLQGDVLQEVQLVAFHLKICVLIVVNHVAECGYMQTVSVGEHPEQSAVEMLGIVNLNPSDANCIYSTLNFVIKQAALDKLKTLCITLDQPLDIKACS
jgi:hypothetical protein